MNVINVTITQRNNECTVTRILVNKKSCLRPNFCLNTKSFLTQNFCSKTELFKFRDVRKPRFDCIYFSLIVCNCPLWFIVELF